MSNPLFNALGGKKSPNMMQQFQQFMQQMKGQDPNKILNELVSSGKVTQQQLDQAQKQAQQMQSMFQPLRTMYDQQSKE